MKVLLLVVVLLVLLWLLRSGPRGGRAASPRSGSRPRAPARDAGQPVPMVACVHCGLHLPRDEAVVDGAGRSFCSEAHRLAGPR
ncbi:MAG: hypothetical protein KGN16_08290 [Burkholderiales bacterium]|nr:hypothetical protein [Burkholderiales bacterium]